MLRGYELLFGEARTIKAFMAGKEATMVAVHISAVHHRSWASQNRSREQDLAGPLTACCIIDVVVSDRVDEES